MTSLYERILEPAPAKSIRPAGERFFGKRTAGPRSRFGRLRWARMDPPERFGSPSPEPFSGCQHVRIDERGDAGGAPVRLTPKQFRVLNYRNIDDSGWIPLERVTAFVGRNEAGKTALLKALHKFNPATEEPYNPQRQFPRDHFTAECRDGGEWPVCQVEFELATDSREQLGERLNGAGIPRKAVLTRCHDGSLKYQYDTNISDDPVDPGKLVEALQEFARGARRLAAPAPDQEASIQALRTQLADCADERKEVAKKLQDLRSEKGVNLLGQVRGESNGYAQPASADLVETLQRAVDELRNDAEMLPLPVQLDEAVENIPTDVLDRAEALFKELMTRFAGLDGDR